MKSLLLAAICFSTCLANNDTTESAASSPNGCFGDDGSCFYYESRSKLNWNDAENACKQSRLGGHLASLTSKDETTNFLEWSKELLFTEDKAWIGLNSIGLDGDFQWVDGRLVDYTNWETPQKVYAQHVCVYVTETGSWEVTECKERHVAICRTTVATSITTPTTTTTTDNSTTPFQGYCPKGSFTFDASEEKCYQLFGNKLSWSDAAKACRSNGQELVAVHNIQEQEFLTALLGKMNTSVWIGLKKSPPGEMYRWSDSSEFDFSNWAPRQPSDQQMCVEMLGNSKQGGKWNDRSCEQKQGYICQRNRDTSISTTIAPSSKCLNKNETFYEYLDSCYRVFYDEGLSWSEAQSYCESYGGSLASITNAQEFAFLSLLRRYIPDDLWIGLSAADAKKGLFEWADDWPVLITEWEQNEPVLDMKSNRTCVVMTELNNKWVVKDCEESSNFICKYTDASPPPVPRPHGKCPDPGKTEVEWTNIGDDYCYYINKESLRTWGEASKLCTELYPGARLASVHSQSEGQALHEITDYNESFWIGLAQGQHGFKWSDESPVNFVSWNRGVDLTSNRNCVALNGHNATWNTSDCNTNLGFICMVDKEEATTTTQITTVTKYPRICGPPASGWIYYDENCYKVYSDWQKSFTWESAKDFCKGLMQPSELASIHSEEENDFIHKQMKDLDNEDFWLGMYRPGKHVEFLWTDNSVVDFTKVAYIKMKEEDQCISINQKTGSWNQTDCNKQNGLVCKYPYNSSVVTTTPMITSTEYAGYCEVGWTRLGNKCVKIFDDTHLNWTQAQETCKRNYEDLFAIHNSHEEMVITSLLENYNHSLWIGLKRYSQKDQFEWSDGTKLDYYSWGAGEPSGSLEMCVSMETSIVRAGSWRNSMCSDKRGYICQNYPSKTVTTTTPEYDNRTEDGFVKYGSADYKFELNLTMASTWNEAEIACMKYGGHLASINSLYEQAFIYTQLDSVTDVKGIWIGLEDMTENGIFKWADNWPIYFTDWAPMEPRHPSHNTRCVYLDLETEKWKSADCEQPRPYICKVTDEKPPPIPHVNNGTCPEHLANWTDVGNDFCYYIGASKNDTALSWSDASKSCEDRGASLASIHSHEELDMLVPYFRYATRATWIGMRKKFEAGFEWDDYSAMNFVHWGKDYPTGDPDNKCVSMSQYNIGWRDENCDTKRGFICKVLKETLLPTQTTPTTDNSTSETTDVTDTTLSGSTSNGTESSSASSVTTATGPVEPTTGLGAGGIAGIVIACLVAVALVAGGAIFYMRRRRRSEEELLINDHSSP